MGPLAGMKVIELASIGPGPMCAMLLADLGAQVTRIDRLAPSGLGVPVPSQFDVMGRGRRSLALDLKATAGRDAALRLIETSDVLVEGWRPGVAERLGLGPEVCLSRNPRLVYGRMTGFGQTGPLAEAAGHDINYIALSGALHAIGGPAAALPPLNLVGDFGGGALYLAFGVMAALWERQRSGRGQVVDAAMVDGASSLMTMFHGLAAAGQWNAASRGDNLLDGGAPFYATYACACGGQVAVGALEPKFFAELARRIGLDARFLPGQYDRSTWPALRDALAAIFRTRTRDDWSALLDGSDACAAPVLSLHEAPRHPHAAARAAFVDVGGLPQPAPAPRFSRTPAAVPDPPPREGQHSRQVLLDAGFSPDEVNSLLASGVLRQDA